MQAKIVCRRDIEAVIADAVKKMPRDELELNVNSLAWRLTAFMTLPELKDWRGKLIAMWGDSALHAAEGDA
jgi:hypothetical protein